MLNIAKQDVILMPFSLTYICLGWSCSVCDIFNLQSLSYKSLYLPVKCILRYICSCDFFCIFDIYQSKLSRENLWYVKMWKIIEMLLSLYLLLNPRHAHENKSVHQKTPSSFNQNFTRENFLRNFGRLFLFKRGSFFLNNISQKYITLLEQ